MNVKTKGSEALRLMVAPPRVSQFEIAQACDVSQQAVSAWARGHMQPTPERMRVLQDRFGIPMESWTDDAPKERPARRRSVNRRRKAQPHG